MPINITMPALSPTMEEGNLAKWLVKEGDTVTSGDVIAEIETDKATMEVEAVDEGTIAKILVAEGTEAVKVNSIIAVIAEEGEDASAIEAPAASAAPAPSAAEPASAEAPAPTVPSGDVSATPLAKRVAAQEGVDLGSVSGTGAKGKIVVADVTGAGTGAATAAGRLFASPLARASAKEAEIDLAKVSGSGPNGRIIQRDVEAAIASGTAKIGSPEPAAEAPKATAPALATGPADDVVLGMLEEGTYELKPHDGMRKIIASRLTESTQTIPSYFITVDCELDNLLALRADMNSAAPVGENDKPEWKISVNDFIVKAMAIALQKVPMANAAWTSSARVLHKHSDVGVAVAIPDGLFTPIVRQAELKSLSVISSEIKDMAGRAKNKKLMPHEYQGGSTAVSNLGMFGVKEFTSIINPPHASILSIGAGEKRPVVRGNELTIATLMTATFAFDHRVIDGALGAELAAAFKVAIEKPAGMLA
ncbi:MAG: 2-oxo acid dehydrogenase subunit E2 [Pseudomonadota bacterium]